MAKETLPLDNIDEQKHLKSILQEFKTLCRPFRLEGTKRIESEKLRSQLKTMDVGRSKTPHILYKDLERLSDTFNKLAEKKKSPEKVSKLQEKNNALFEEIIEFTQSKFSDNKKAPRGLISGLKKIRDQKNQELFEKTQIPQGTVLDLLEQLEHIAKHVPFENPYETDARDTWVMAPAPSFKQTFTAENKHAGYDHRDVSEKDILKMQKLIVSTYERLGEEPKTEYFQKMLEQKPSHDKVYLDNQSHLKVAQ